MRRATSDLSAARVYAGRERTGERARAAAGAQEATPVAAPSEAAWKDLASRLTGWLLRPGDPLYPPATVINATRYMDQLPQGIAICVSPQDAAACVAWVRETG